MPVRVIYVVALIEGFSTLAVEIIAMRIAIPVVGSSIVLTSVFLGIILLALSAGYRSGGILSSKLDRTGQVRALGNMLLFAGVWYVVISFSFERGLLELMMQTSGSYLTTLFTVVILLFFLPVFIASHSIPLLTELLDEPSKGKAAGSMLFASTVGSFFGSVLTSILFFEWWGVTLTGVIVGCSLVFLAGLVFVWSSKKRALACLVIGCGMGSYFGFQKGETQSIFAFDSAYQHIEIYDATYKGNQTRIFSTNGALSSGIYLDSQEEKTPFLYINELISKTEALQPRSLLLIGSAGFTYPQIVSAQPTLLSIDAIDIDPKVKEVAEAYFLEEPLDDKITFYPYSARGVVGTLQKEQKSYDLIVLDAYNDKSVPEELMTIEFFQSIQSLLSDDGVVLANMIMDKKMTSDFATSALATMKRVFGNIYYTNITNNAGYEFDNFIVSTSSLPGYRTSNLVSETIYTDNRHGAGMDSVNMLYR